MEKRRLWYFLLLPPYAAFLFPALYARVTPAIGGVPFFYWWQLAWIVITALLTALVYKLTTSDNEN